MDKEKRIFRSLGHINREIDQENSRLITGQAIVFDSWSRDLGGFIEKINQGAITEDLLSNSDVIMNFNHNDEKILARYIKGEGTLSLDLREDGLYFSFEAPETALGDEVLFNVRNGNLFECSFACYLDKKDIRRYRDGDIFRQEITNIALLHDISIVISAAYSSTSVSARSAEEAKEEFEDIKRDVEEAEKAELENKEAEERAAREKEILEQLKSKREEFLAQIKH